MKLMLKRFPIIVLLALLCLCFHAHDTQAQAKVPLGSCGDSVSDDANLFGNRIGDVVNQATAMNNSLQVDTRVVTVSPNTLGSRSLRDYFYYIESKCPAWGEPQFVVLILAKGYEPFLHLGSTSSGKMTAADFQQMTLSTRSELTSGNYAQAAIDLLKQVQQKLSPNYTWIWITVGVIVILGVAGALALVLLRRKQAIAAETAAQGPAIQARQAAVNACNTLSKQIEDLSPRIEVLLALTPQSTATQLSTVFGNVKEQARIPEERLGSLLSNPDANPSARTSRIEHYTQLQRAYQEVYSEAQDSLSSLHGIENAVQSLESNPQEQIDFHQLTRQSMLWHN